MTNKSERGSCSTAAEPGFNAGKSSTSATASSVVPHTGAAVVTDVHHTADREKMNENARSRTEARHKCAQLLLSFEDRKAATDFLKIVKRSQKALAHLQTFLDDSNSGSAASKSSQHQDSTASTPSQSSSSHKQDEDHSRRDGQEDRSASGRSQRKSSRATRTSTGNSNANLPRGSSRSTKSKGGSEAKAFSSSAVICMDEICDHYRELWVSEIIGMKSGGRSRDDHEEDGSTNKNLKKINDLWLQPLLRDVGLTQVGLAPRRRLRAAENPSVHELIAKVNALIESTLMKKLEPSFQDEHESRGDDDDHQSEKEIERNTLMPSIDAATLQRCARTLCCFLLQVHKSSTCVDVDNDVDVRNEKPPRTSSSQGAPEFQQSEFSKLGVLICKLDSIAEQLIMAKGARNMIALRQTVLGEGGAYAESLLRHPSVCNFGNGEQVGPGRTFSNRNRSTRPDSLERSSTAASGSFVESMRELTTGPNVTWMRDLAAKVVAPVSQKIDLVDNYTQIYNCLFSQDDELELRGDDYHQRQDEVTLVEDDARKRSNLCRDRGSKKNTETFIAQIGAEAGAGVPSKMFDNIDDFLADGDEDVRMDSSCTQEQVTGLSTSTSRANTTTTTAKEKADSAEVRHDPSPLDRRRIKPSDFAFQMAERLQSRGSETADGNLVEDFVHREVSFVGVILVQVFSLERILRPLCIHRGACSTSGHDDLQNTNNSGMDNAFSSEAISENQQCLGCRGDTQDAGTRSTALYASARIFLQLAADFLHLSAVPENIDEQASSPSENAFLDLFGVAFWAAIDALTRSSRMQFLRAIAPQRSADHFLPGVQNVAAPSERGASVYRATAEFVTSVQAAINTALRHIEARPEKLVRPRPFNRNTTKKMSPEENKDSTAPSSHEQHKQKQDLLPVEHFLMPASARAALANDAVPDSKVDHEQASKTTKPMEDMPPNGRAHLSARACEQRQRVLKELVRRGCYCVLVATCRAVWREKMNTHVEGTLLGKWYGTSYNVWEDRTLPVLPPHVVEEVTTLCDEQLCNQKNARSSLEVESTSATALFRKRNRDVDLEVVSRRFLAATPGRACDSAGSQISPTKWLSERLSHLASFSSTSSGDDTRDKEDQMSSRARDSKVDWKLLRFWDTASELLEAEKSEGIDAIFQQHVWSLALSGGEDEAASSTRSDSRFLRSIIRFTRNLQSRTGGMDDASGNGLNYATTDFDQQSESAHVVDSFITGSANLLLFQQLADDSGLSQFVSHTVEKMHAGVERVTTSVEQQLRAARQREADQEIGGAQGLEGEINGGSVDSVRQPLTFILGQNFVEMRRTEPETMSRQLKRRTKKIWQGQSPESRGVHRGNDEKEGTRREEHFSRNYSDRWQIAEEDATFVECTLQKQAKSRLSNSPTTKIASRDGEASMIEMTLLMASGSVTGGGGLSRYSNREVLRFTPAQLLALLQNGTNDLENGNASSSSSSSSTENAFETCKRGSPLMCLAIPLDDERQKEPAFRTEVNRSACTWHTHISVTDHTKNKPVESSLYRLLLFPFTSDFLRFYDFVLACLRKDVDTAAAAAAAAAMQGGSSSREGKMSQFGSILAGHQDRQSLESIRKKLRGIGAPLVNAVVGTSTSDHILLKHVTTRPNIETQRHAENCRDGGSLDAKSRDAKDAISHPDLADFLQDDDLDHLQFEIGRVADAVVEKKLEKNADLFSTVIVNKSNSDSSIEIKSTRIMDGLLSSFGPPRRATLNLFSDEEEDILSAEVLSLSWHETVSGCPGSGSGCTSSSNRSDPASSRSPPGEDRRFKRCSSTLTFSFHAEDREYKTPERETQLLQNVVEVENGCHDDVDTGTVAVQINAHAEEKPRVFPSLLFYLQSSASDFDDSPKNESPLQQDLSSRIVSNSTPPGITGVTENLNQGNRFSRVENACKSREHYTTASANSNIGDEQCLQKSELDSEEAPELRSDCLDRANFAKEGAQLPQEVGCAQDRKMKKVLKRTRSFSEPTTSRCTRPHNYRLAFLSRKFRNASTSPSLPQIICGDRGPSGEGNQDHDDEDGESEQQLRRNTSRTSNSFTFRKKSSSSSNVDNGGIIKEKPTTSSFNGRKWRCQEEEHQGGPSLKDEKPAHNEHPTLLEDEDVDDTSDDEEFCVLPGASLDDFVALREHRQQEECFDSEEEEALEALRMCHELELFERDAVAPLFNEDNTNRGSRNAFNTNAESEVKPQVQAGVASSWYRRATDQAGAVEELEDARTPGSLPSARLLEVKRPGSVAAEGDMTGEDLLPGGSRVPSLVDFEAFLEDADGKSVPEEQLVNRADLSP
ncbi:unnamed protein product [Amoebophrya sp. A25]|nr:unnamed protein product [Amoebophrya sp. A25]|eukprot:GSA25T00006025001.1